MATKIVPIAPLGEVFHGIPAPNADKPARHTVTVNMPTWNMMLEVTKKDPAFVAKIVDFYPRILLHRDVMQVKSQDRTGNAQGKLLIWSAYRSDLGPHQGREHNGLAIPKFEGSERMRRICLSESKNRHYGPCSKGGIVHQGI